MPVSTTIWLLAGLVLLVLSPWAAMAAQQAQPRGVVIRHAKQLQTDKTVHGLQGTYAALSDANVIYSECGKQFAITEDQKAYLAKKFSEVSNAYLQAYQDAYSAQVQSPPTQKFLDEVVTLIKNEQQAAVNETAKIIQKTGCDGRLKPMLNYVEALHKQDIDAAKPKPKDDDDLVTPSAPQPTTKN